MADISSTLVSNSSQLDNIDLQGGARDFTITGVTLHAGSDQPLSIALAEYDRPWKPGLTMRRLLSEIWGPESDSWIGRRVRLYRDASVTFGKLATGGTRISHATNIDGPITATLPISKGKFGEFTVQPLTASTSAAAPTPEQIDACTDLETLGRMWKASGPKLRGQIEARVEEIKAASAPPDDPALNSHWDTAAEAGA